MLDRILTFLFRRKSGLFVLLGLLFCSVFAMSGCFSWSCLSCVCGSMGCDTCAEAYAECNNQFSCDTGCGPIDCMFGNGCVSDCGCGTIACGGCNSSLCTDCGASCSGSGCSDCSAQCANCYYEGEDNIADDDPLDPSDDSSCGSCGGCFGCGGGSGDDSSSYQFRINYKIFDSNGNLLDERVFKDDFWAEGSAEAPDTRKWSVVAYNPGNSQYSYYGSVYKVIDKNGQEMNIVDGEVEFDTSDWDDSVYEYTTDVSLYVSEKRSGEPVEITIDYSSIGLSSETYNAVVGGQLSDISPKQIPGRNFVGFYLRDASGDEKKIELKAGAVHLYPYGIDPDSTDLDVTIYAKYEDAMLSVKVIKKLNDSLLGNPTEYTAKDNILQWGSVDGATAATGYKLVLEYLDGTSETVEKCAYTTYQLPSGKSIKSVKISANGNGTTTITSKPVEKVFN